VMPKGAAAFDLNFRFTSEGHLVEVADDGISDSPDRVELISEMVGSAYQPGAEVTTAELLDLGQALGISARSSMMGYIQVLVRRGQLQDGGHGHYRVPAVQ
jgi:hypothetical protein